MMFHGMPGRLTCHYWQLVEDSGTQPHMQQGRADMRVTLQVRAHAPEVLVVMQCGVSPQGVLACVTELAALPGWWGLPAVKNGCVYIVDHAPFLRPGPRVVRSSASLPVGLKDRPQYRARLVCLMRNT